MGRQEESKAVRRQEGQEEGEEGGEESQNGQKQGQEGQESREEGQKDREEGQESLVAHIGDDRDRQPESDGKEGVQEGIQQGVPQGLHQAAATQRPGLATQGQTRIGQVPRYHAWQKEQETRQEEGQEEDFEEAQKECQEAEGLQPFQVNHAKDAQEMEEEGRPAQEEKGRQ